MKDFELTGNVIHTSWFQTITKTNGKADLVAINILAEIVYWYKPREIRDELTGAHLGWKNKYKEDLLQKSYTSLADQFGLTERQVKGAIKSLEELGVIERVFRNITRNGMNMYNVLYIKLNTQRLIELSVINQEVSELNKEKRKKKRKRKKKGCRNVLVNSRSGQWTHIKKYQPPTLECDTSHIKMDTLPHYNDTPPTLECDTPCIKTELPPHCNVEPPTLNCDTNTKITTRITTETSSSSSEKDEEELHAGVRECMNFWENNFYLLRGYDFEIIADLCNSHPVELIIEAMKVAKKNNARALSYVESTLIDWQDNGITTVEAAKSYLKERGGAKNARNNSRPSTKSISTESVNGQDENTAAQTILEERGCTAEELKARASRHTNF